MICTTRQQYSGDKIKKNVMGGACGTHGVLHGFGGEI
jgi:hypothetical protein